MKLGICIPIDRIPDAVAAGFDYVEIGAASAVDPHNLDQDGILERLNSALSGAGATLLVINSILPWDFKLVGPERNLSEMSAYAATLCRRARLAGVGLLVFGSGGARKAPEGYSREAAFEDLRVWVRLLASHAADNDVRIAVEPLNRGETNMIISIAEAMELVAAAGDDGSTVGVLADLYHMTVEGESMAAIRPAAEAGLLWHAHVACGTDRHTPAAGDEEQLLGFLGALKDCGYDGAVSLESGLDGADLRGAADLMRRCMAAV